MAEHIVFRHAPDVPLADRAPAYEGRWIERPEPRIDYPDEPAPAARWSLVAVSTDRFETREDGATARVFEIHPREVEIHG